VTPFDLVEPASLKEAIALIDPDDPDVRAIAGGTALMLMMKAGVFSPKRLVSLRRIGDSFSKISMTAAGDLVVGAMTPLSAIEHSPEVLRHAPVIARTMTRLSNVRVRNVATIGGALAHADPHMDLPPVLIALGASATIVGPSGERSMAVEDLLTGYYETALATPARRDPCGLFQSHDRLSRRLAGARRSGCARHGRFKREIRPYRC
jgi:carbon-monoxide dehydrogenase medium subunit